MGKSTTSLTLIVQSLVQGNVSQAQDLPVAITPEAIGTIHRKTKINLGDQNHDAMVFT